MSPPATFDEFSEPSLLEVELETDDDQAAETIDTAEVLGDLEGAPKRPSARGWGQASGRGRRKRLWRFAVKVCWRTTNWTTHVVRSS